MIKRVKGTQDLLDMKSYDAVQEAATRHFGLAGFAHIQTPILEHLALFKRSVGEDTDIVGKEMYTLQTNETDVLCLRPEATASTVRAFYENGIQTRPWRVFSYGPMFRHERPQKGRFRQFSQFNIEVIGTPDVMQDATFVWLLDDLFTHALSLTDYTLSINYLGNKEDRLQHKEALRNFLQTHSARLCATCLTRSTSNILRIFDCKEATCQEAYQQAPKITDHLSAESTKEWQELNEMLDVLSINRIHNPALVRGLDYYNGLVFEFSSPLLGAQSTFCGGGRYDLSFAFEQKEALPSIGSAFGMERLVLLLEAAGNPHLSTSTVTMIGVLPCDESTAALGLLALQTLHRAGLNALLLSDGIKKGMKKANLLKVKWLVIIGEEERQSGMVQVKNMENGAQRSISQEELASHLLNATSER